MRRMICGVHGLGHITRNLRGQAGLLIHIHIVAERDEQQVVRLC